MSVARAFFIGIQAIFNQLASTPPNPTPPKGRYHTDELYILQIAPLTFKIQKVVFWAFAAFEIMHSIATAKNFPFNSSTNLLCFSRQSQLRITPLTIAGVMSVVLGACIRLSCFRALGNMFTFDLTVHPEHKLVKSGLYGYVRHPAYTGSLLLIAGLAMSHFSAGSWATECGPLRFPGSSIVIGLVWWIWAISVCISRAVAEDKQMHVLFGEEWSEYATNVRWWFIPGVF